MTCEEAKKIVKPRLSEKRWTHTKNVKKMAVKLAKQWGADPEKAAVAAILHDSAKEMPKAELLQIFADNAIIAENAPARPSPVWHGIAAAILAETQWGVTDPEILSAIRCHTTGKLNMTKLDKIIYLADMTSAERDWPGVEDLRKLEMQDLDRALCDALKRSIDFVEERAARWTLKAWPHTSMQKSICKNRKGSQSAAAVSAVCCFVAVPANSKNREET